MRKDSFDYFLSSERGKYHEDFTQSYLNKRALEPASVNLHFNEDTEETFSLCTYIVRVLLAKIHCRVEELVEYVDRAYESVKGNKREWDKVFSSNRSQFSRKKY